MANDLRAGADVATAARRGLSYAPLVALNQAMLELEFAEAARLLHWMESSASASERPNEHTHAAFLSRCGAGPSLESARTLWRRLTVTSRLPSARVCTALLGCLGRAGEVVEARELLQRMAWEELPGLDTRAFNAALGAAAAAGAWSEAQLVWTELCAWTRSAPDALSLSLLLLAADRGAAWREGLAVAMSDAGRRVRMDAPLAGSLLGVAGKAGQPQVVSAVWAQVAQLRLPLSTHLCNSYLGALASSGDSAEARRVLGAMRAGGIARDVRSFTAVMAATRLERDCDARTRLRMMRAVLVELRAEGLSPSMVTLNVLLTGLGDAALWREAEATAEEWRQRYALGPLDLRCWNSLIRACCRAEQPGEALRLFHAMQAAGCLPSRATFVMLGSLSDDPEVAGSELRRLRASLEQLELSEMKDAAAEARAAVELPAPAEESFAPGSWAQWALDE